MQKLMKVDPLNVPQNHHDSPLDSLFKRINYERQTPGHIEDEFRLDTMACLLDLLGNPQHDVPAVHIAGTKGKGSVATIVAAVLHEAGFRTGLYTSPHLESICERYRFNGKQIGQEELDEVLSVVLRATSDVDGLCETNDKLHPPTFFEIATATAFLWFRRKNVDFAVIEVGLGGRLDSTNLCHPVLTAITNISRDHTRQLGDDLKSIAFEKSGIIKPGVPVVVGAEQEEVLEVIRSIANERSAPAIIWREHFDLNRPAAGNLEQPSLANQINVFGDLGNHEFAYDALKPAMHGRHQFKNVALSVVIVELISKLGYSIPKSAFSRGVADAAIAGRLEQIADTPCLIADIAHNVASAQSLIHWIKDIEQQGRMFREKKMLFSSSNDKEISEILKVLLPHFDQVVFTQFGCNPRACPVQDLVEMANSVVDKLSIATSVTSVNDAIGAWDHVVSDLHEDDLLCVAGSAFLIAELRSKMQAYSGAPSITR